MKKIIGTVADKRGASLGGATILLKDKHFQDVATAIADQNGHYCLEAEEGRYPYLLAVRDYAELFLEHWVGNIPLFEDLEISFSLDSLEVYGLTCFQIRGGAPALSIYFRPMSLERAKAGEADISPELDVDSIAVRVNGEPVSVGTLSTVTEFYPSSREGDPQTITGCFLMTTLPASGLKEADNRLDIRIQDPGSGAIGCAGLYFDPLKL